DFSAILFIPEKTSPMQLWHFCNRFNPISLQERLALASLSPREFILMKQLHSLRAFPWEAAAFRDGSCDTAVAETIRKLTEPWIAGLFTSSNPDHSE
ncbi:hypothetical protein N7520_002406, partial [Penicillium odoratum]|uniref:uncharacterized protein n=1 Tax=Penicillium odoratum TaxID=1167516 RepID=UPI0025489595